jgi:outer membrane protein assembly factor BamB
MQRKGGKTIWDKTVDPVLPEQPRIRDDHGYASSTPVSDGKNVYVFFGKSGVLGFDLNGKQLWRTSVGTGLHGWGSGASLIQYKDLVIVNASVESKTLYALNKKTGKQVWKAGGINRAWNTPVLVTLKNGRTELVMGIFGKVLGFDPDTGRQLWSCNNDIKWYVVPSVVAADDIVWSLAGRSGVAGIGVRAGGTGDVTGSNRLWTSKKGSNVTSPVIQGTYLYWMHESRGMAFCAEAMTGKIMYEQKIERASQIYGPALLADGNIYYTNRRGKTFVLAAQPEYKLLATNDLKDGGAFNGGFAVSGTNLLIRSDKFLYCIGKK